MTAKSAHKGQPASPEGTDATKQDSALHNALLNANVIVTVGSGGVGKTTSAAAIAIAAARHGRRCAVLTIDPAKRLAQALGVEQLGNTPQHLPKDFVGPGSVDAMMLETASAFDDLIRKLENSPERQQRLLNNRLYLLIARHLGGTHEYMAVEKLFELVNERDYDLVVLDTPPSVNALDFLEAPQRITSFFSDRIQKYFVRRKKERFNLIEKMKNRAGEIALSILGKALGDVFIEDVQDFATAFQSLFASFRERGHAIQALFNASSTVFTIVSGPDPVRIAEALRFADTLEKHGIQPEAFIINRVHSTRHEEAHQLTAEDLQAVSAKSGIDLAMSPADILRASERAQETQEALCVRDQEGVRQMVRTIGRYRLLIVPELRNEVEDANALEHMVSSLAHSNHP